MLSKGIKREVELLRKDNRSGAADLHLRAIEIIRQYLKTPRVQSKSEFLIDLRELCGQLMFAQVTLPAIRNTCIAVLSNLSMYRDGSDLESLRRRLENRLAKLSAKVSHARIRIANHLGKILPVPAHLLTLSYSSTVMAVLRELKRRGRELEVTVLESRPMLEGHRTAKDLLREGIATTLIADASMGEFARLSDLVIVGADTVYSDGSVVNKIGTHPLALCSQEAGKPFYVLADSSKLSLDPPAKFYLERKKPSELFKGSPKGLSVENIYFDLTPSKYVTAIITEGGILSPRRRPGKTN